MAERQYPTYNPETQRTEIWATDDQGNFRFVGLPGQAGGTPTAPRGITVEPTSQLNRETQMLIAKMQQEYLYERLRLIDQPGLEIEKHRLALDAARQFAELTGFVVNMDAFNTSLSTNPATSSFVPTVAKVSPGDLTNIKAQLQKVGWPGGTDDEAVSKFLELSGNDPTQQDLVGRLKGAGAAASVFPTFDPATKAALDKMGAGFKAQYGRDPTQDEQMGWLNEMAQRKAGQGTPGLERPWDVAANLLPGGFERYTAKQGRYERGEQKWIPNLAPTTPGAIPTFEGANLMANPRTFAENLTRLGLSPEASNQMISGAPNAGQIPTTAFTKMAQAPENIAQTLLMLGYNKDQVDQYMANTPLYRQLTGQTGAYQIPNQPGIPLQEPSYQLPPQQGIPLQTGGGFEPPSWGQPGPPNDWYQIPTQPYTPLPTHVFPGGGVIPGEGTIPTQPNAPYIGQRKAGGGYYPPGGAFYPGQSPGELGISSVGPGQPLQEGFQIPQQPNAPYIGQGAYQLPQQLGQPLQEPGGTIGPVGPGSALTPDMARQIQGRYLPGRQTIRQLRSSPRDIEAISGMASYYGVDPRQLWGEFQEFLPRGSRNPLSRFV